MEIFKIIHKQCLLLFIVLLSASAVEAQSPTVPIRSSGPVPADFTYYIGKKSGCSAKEAQNYRDLFTSGMVIYGSPMNQYIEKVADNLLATNPVLRSKLRFYVVRSSEANAASFANGMVLVNTGLLAQLQNESELAFILAHEIAHFDEKHIEKAAKGAKEDRKKTRRNDYENRYLTYKNRSREHETEADQVAFERYYKTSPYSFQALNGVFDVLQYAYLPFDEIPFKRSWVETDFYHFPDEYFLPAVKPVRSREDYVDTLCSHPNLQKRRAWIHQQTSSANDAGRSLFVQNESLFYEMRDLARRDCIDLYLTMHAYADAYYNSYVMLQQAPTDTFLRRAICVSLYGIAKHKISGCIDDAVPNYKDIEGEKQQVNHFFRKVTRDEILLLALRSAWQNRDDEFCNKLLRDIIASLYNKKALDYNKYSDFPMGTEIDTELPKPKSIAKENSDTTLSKYDRIKTKKEGNRDLVYPTEKFKTANYMLVDLRKNDSFWKCLEEVQSAQEDEKVLGQFGNSHNPGLSRPTLVWMPQFYKRMMGQSDYHDKSRSFTRAIAKSCKKLKLNIHIADIDSLITSSSESYNQFCDIQQWHDDYIYAQSADMLLYNGDGAMRATSAMGYQNINFVMGFSHPYNFAFQYKWTPIVAAVLVPLSTPFAIANLFSFNYESKAFFSIIDVQDSKTLYQSSLNCTEELTDAYLHNFIYCSYHEIKKLGGRK